MSMDAITYSQVQELVMKLPSTKLPLAYSLLVSLAENETEALSPQLDYFLLPTADRHRLLAQQAEEMLTHYEQTSVERESWQAGDFIDAD
jgi:hypothetical protein